MKNINLKPAKPENSEKVIELIYITGPDLFLYMFGKKAKDILGFLFKNEGNLFSYEHCKVVLIKDKIAGMVLGYGYETIGKESKNTGRLIIKYFGLKFLFRVFSLIKMNRIISDLDIDHFYISNIAVYDKFRGFGVGRILIENAIKEAKGQGKRYISLDVEADNLRAIGFYKHLGFKNTGEKTLSFGLNKRVTLLRMVKDCL